MSRQKPMSAQKPLDLELEQRRVEVERLREAPPAAMLANQFLQLRRSIHALIHPALICYVATLDPMGGCPLIKKAQNDEIVPTDSDYRWSAEASPILGPRNTPGDSRANKVGHVRSQRMIMRSSQRLEVWM